VVYSITLILLCAWIARFDCEQLGSQVKFLGPWACNVPFFFFKEKKKKILLWMSAWFFSRCHPLPYAPSVLLCLPPFILFFDSATQPPPPSSTDY
jgi:hypothetical protein